MPRRRREAVVVEVQQPSLTLEERYQPTFAEIAPANIQIPSTQVSTDFVENVRALGVIQPVAVVDMGSTLRGQAQYRIAAGRRRVQAARECRMGTMPAMVYPVGTPLHVAAAMALSENVQRRPNPLNDLDSIQDMVARGHDERSIAAELRMPLSTLRQRMRLASLLPALRDHMSQGRLSPTVAYRVAALDGDRQRNLLATLNQRVGLGQVDARITEPDVRDVTQAIRRQQVDALPPEVFATPSAVVENRTVEVVVRMDGSVPEGWPTFQALIRAAQQALPSAPDPAIESIVQTLEEIQASANRLAR